MVIGIRNSICWQKKKTIIYETLLLTGLKIERKDLTVLVVWMLQLASYIMLNEMTI